MAKEVKKTEKPTDATIIDGVYRHDRKMGNALYELCFDYFNEYFHPITNVCEYDRDDIFQNSLETLLNKIEQRKIFVEDGELKGRGGKKFTSKLTTFFMSIVYLKYKEIFRQPPVGNLIDIDTGKVDHLIKDADLYREILYDEEENVTLSIIADCISKMSERCGQILTLFYYEKKSLDDILVIIPSYNSKNALKTEKNRCLNSLRESVRAIYNRFFI